MIVRFVYAHAPIAHLEVLRSGVVVLYCTVVAVLYPVVVPGLDDSVTTETLAVCGK